MKTVHTFYYGAKKGHKFRDEQCFGVASDKDTAQEWCKQKKHTYWTGKDVQWVDNEQKA